MIVLTPRGASGRDLNKTADGSGCGVVLHQRLQLALALSDGRLWALQHDPDLASPVAGLHRQLHLPILGEGLQVRLQDGLVHRGHAAQHGRQLHVRLCDDGCAVTEEVGEALLAVLGVEISEGSAVDLGDDVPEAQAGLPGLGIDGVHGHAPPARVQVDARALLGPRAQGEAAGGLERSRPAASAAAACAPAPWPTRPSPAGYSAPAALSLVLGLVPEAAPAAVREHPPLLKLRLVLAEAVVDELVVALPGVVPLP
eukprot:CAMPEP_0176303946 /NCGR_PEP_ID=MMETSP0121_2-20121125/62175_1 /TAXON_ID=160619 /ORGANISM="Kryptoperidinium foliaceum, Strain CCMP 1326" /LENGTH=255 /DNA_ID=CAMNT_0017645533 /DNA_START=69 /DNA_END=834 /DNA_ORIENTATION=-